MNNLKRYQAARLITELAAKTFGCKSRKYCKRASGISFALIQPDTLGGLILHISATAEVPPKSLIIFSTFIMFNIVGMPKFKCQAYLHNNLLGLVK